MDTFTNAPDGPLVVPPRNILLKLQDYAQGGYINDIRQVIAEIKQEDSAFIPFARQIEQLADQFQVEKIIAYLTPYLEETP